MTVTVPRLFCRGHFSGHEEKKTWMFFGRGRSKELSFLSCEHNYCKSHIMRFHLQQLKQMCMILFSNSSEYLDDQFIVRRFYE